jgi:hypothetical protein
VLGLELACCNEQLFKRQLAAALSHRYTICYFEMWGRLLVSTPVCRTVVAGFDARPGTLGDSSQQYNDEVDNGEVVRTIVHFR